jgi:FkbM family methyltransferase
MPDNLIKKILKAFCFPENCTRRILFGPSKGLKYKVNSISGISAIYGVNQRCIQKAFLYLVKQNMVVYDIGANVGLFTILLSKLVGKQGRVYSFEPVPCLAEQISINAKLNNLNNVTVIEKAVSDSVSYKNFYIGNSFCEGHIFNGSKDKDSYCIQVSCIALDYFVFDKGNPPPHLIKIDVEGGESGVFNGAKKVIEKYRPVIICDLHNPKQDTEVGKMLISYNYGAYRLNDGEFVKDLKKGWPNVTGLWGSFVGYPLEKTPSFVLH